MPDVKEIAAYLEEKVPSSLKMDFNNVGLLCGFPDTEVKRILVSLDVTLETISEAEEWGASLIVSHHPVIFEPLRRLRSDSPTGKRVIELIRAGISAVCLHTNLDRLPGGVNSALAKALGAKEELPLSDCGCTALLPGAVTLEEFLVLTENALHAGDIRYYNAGRRVRRLALCGGAGGDIVEEAAQLDCDTVVTGEIRHHQWIDGRELGLNLIEAGHFSTENVVTPVLCELLRERFPGVEVRLSRMEQAVSRGWSF